MKDSLSVVIDRTCFAVTKALGPDYLSAERMHDPLMTKTYPKGRSFATDLSQNFRTDAEVSRVCRCSRTRRDYDPVRGKSPNCRNVHFIVSFHNYLVSDLSYILGQVVDEAVVVVQDEDFQTLSL